MSLNPSFSTDSSDQQKPLVLHNVNSYTLLGAKISQTTSSKLPGLSSRTTTNCTIKNSSPEPAVLIYIRFRVCLTHVLQSFLSALFLPCDLISFIEDYL